MLCDFFCVFHLNLDHPLALDGRDVSKPRGLERDEKILATDIP